MRDLPDRPHRRILLRGAFLVFLTVGVAAPLLVAAGTTRYVDDNTCPSPGAGTPASPYCRIQDAICVAVSGDTVSVAPGTYPEAVRMRPGVSLVSQGGPSVTTINAAGQPCTENTFCAKRTGNACSVVTFASGHTLSTRLEGFKVTGGAGLVQTGTVNHVAGGGIFVFSSPTIANNVITNNVLSGNQREYKGAGVYIAVGSPVITGNTITGNRAAPGPGTGTALTYGYGGGIWVNFNTAPVIVNNIIAGNRAGDPSADYSLGVGGGIAVFPGDASHPGPMIDRNLVADNEADSMGGGIGLGSIAGTAALAVVTNNVIVGNSAKNGGGVYIYFNKSSTINNTIADNSAFLGGGLYTGQSDPTLPVEITNNIIVGNRIDPFGNGGGVYTLDLSAAFDPIICFNLFWENERNQVAGDQTDGTVLGACGNFSADPRFLNRAARDFHLNANSPAIDRGKSSGAPPVDHDNRARGQDGNGVPNNPVAGDVDIGAYEVAPFCLPSAELCDGLDNNCDQLVDEGYADTDGDLVADCVDPDDDNDGVSDVTDCASLDAGSFGAPYEVVNLDVTGSSPAVVSFDVQNIGSTTRYEVLAGLLSRLGATGGFQEDFCVSPVVTGGAWPDARPEPPSGDGWFYEVRSANGCGYGTLGSAAADAAGAGDVCAAGVVDADADGSPSDLDCSDTDAGVSPLRLELCDGVDNNCDQAVDEGNPGGGSSCGSAVGECVLGLTMCGGGSLSCVGAVGPSPEVCDGLDNDCSGAADDNMVDSDGDLLTDCVDPDDDNDGVTDGGDCAPVNAGAWGVPVEVEGVDVQTGAGTVVSWQEQALGPATGYEVVTGQIGEPGQVDFAGGTCLGPAAGASPVVDGRTGPPAGAAWYYMVKSRNICGAGTYGTPARDAHPPCP